MQEMLLEHATLKILNLLTFLNQADMYLPVCTQKWKNGPSLPYIQNESTQRIMVESSLVRILAQKWRMKSEL